VQEGDGLFSPPAVRSSCHGEHGKGAHGYEPSSSDYVVCLIPYQSSSRNSTYISDISHYHPLHISHCAIVELRTKLEVDRFLAQLGVFYTRIAVSLVNFLSG
jgi:hypothetical protein